jgi:hypothetical protein
MWTRAGVRSALRTKADCRAGRYQDGTPESAAMSNGHACRTPEPSLDLVGAREAWIQAARQVTETGTVDVQCPENADGLLHAEWIPVTDGTGGEWRVWCPACGAQNFVLVRDKSGR